MITKDTYNEINRLKNVVANSLKYHNVPVTVTEKAYDNLVNLYKENEADIVLNKMLDDPTNPMWDVLVFDILSNQNNNKFWYSYVDTEIHCVLKTI